MSHKETWEQERESMKKKIAELEGELETQRKLFHVARIMRLRKIEEPEEHVQKLLKLDIEQLDELATITEETFSSKAGSYSPSKLPGIG